MKVEYIDDGSADGPRVRLFDFSPPEAAALREGCRALAAGEATLYVIHRQPFVDSVDGCKLKFSVGPSDAGLLAVNAPGSFRCTLTRAGWDDVAGRVDRCASDGASEWLDRSGPTGLLLSSAETS